MRPSHRLICATVLCCRLFTLILEPILAFIQTHVLSPSHTVFSHSLQEGHEPLKQSTSIQSYLQTSLHPYSLFVTRIPHPSFFGKTTIL